MGLQPEAGSPLNPKTCMSALGVAGSAIASIPRGPYYLGVGVCG